MRLDYTLQLLYHAHQIRFGKLVFMLFSASLECSHHINVYFIHLHCVLFYCNGGCGLSVLCNKEYDDDDDFCFMLINLFS